MSKEQLQKQLVRLLALLGVMCVLAVLVAPVGILAFVAIESRGFHLSTHYGLIARVGDYGSTAGISAAWQSLQGVMLAIIGGFGIAYLPRGKAEHQRWEGVVVVVIGLAVAVFSAAVMSFYGSTDFPEDLTKYKAPVLRILESTISTSIFLVSTTLGLELRSRHLGNLTDNV